MRHIIFNTLFTFIFFNINYLIAQDCPVELTPPHIVISGNNLVENGNFVGESNWNLTDCMDMSWDGFSGSLQTNCNLNNIPIYNSSVTYNNDGTGCLVFDKKTPNCFDIAKTSIDLTGETTSQPEFFTLSFMAKTIDTWPSPNFAVRLLDQSNNTLLENRFAVSSNDIWQECVSHVKLDNNVMNITIELYIEDRVNGKCRTVYIDEVYFAKGKGYKHPPKCKDPFKSDFIQVDELGNYKVKENGKWKNFFPIGIMGGNHRPNFQLYEDHGFNYIARQNYEPYIDKIKGTSLYYSFALGLWLEECLLEPCTDSNPEDCPYGCSTCFSNDWVDLQERLARIFDDPELEDKLLHYYIDNEYPNYNWEEKISNVSNIVECFEKSYFQKSSFGQESQRHPLYLLNGTYGIARQYKASYDVPTELPNLITVDLADITGIYTGSSTSRFDLINNIDGQRMPVVIAQINEVMDNSMGARVFAAIAHGAKGINYFIDKGGPGAPADLPFSHDVTNAEWWDGPDTDPSNGADGFIHVANDINNLLPLIREPHWTDWTATHNGGSGIDIGTRNFNEEGYLIVTNLENSGKTVLLTIENLGYLPSQIETVRHSNDGQEGNGLGVSGEANSFYAAVVLQPFEYGVYKFDNIDIDCDLGETEVFFTNGLADTSGNASIITNVQPVGDYTYSWDDGSTGNTKINVCLGENHSVTITNIFGCSQTYTFEGQLQPGFPFDTTYPCATVSDPTGPFTPIGSFTPLGTFNIAGTSVQPTFLGGGRLTDNLDQIEVWPNPADKVVNIELGSLEYSHAAIKLYSLAGKEVLTQPINDKMDNVDFDVSNINNGIYLLKIITDGQETHTQKLTIAH